MKSSGSRVDGEKQWRDQFPSILAGLFAFYQCLCSIAIVGCEVGSVLIDQFNSTVYVGLWASPFFIAAWISQALAVSRCFTRRCATITLILQCVCVPFAAVLIAFDAYFLSQPAACFFPAASCRGTTTKRGVFYSKTNFNDIKIPVIKGQLAVAAMMMALHIGYIVIYTVTCVGLKKKKPASPASSSKSTDALVDDTKTSISTKTMSTSATVEPVKDAIKVDDLDTPAVSGSGTKSSSSLVEVTKIEEAHGFTKSTKSIESFSQSTSSMKVHPTKPAPSAPPVVTISDEVVSIDATGSSLKDKSTAKPLPPSKAANRIVRQTTYISIPSEKIIKPSLPPTEDTNPVSEKRPSVERTGLPHREPSMLKRETTLIENMLAPRSRTPQTNTNLYATSWVDDGDDDKSTLLKPIEKVPTPPANPFTFNADAVAKPAPSPPAELIVRSRWSFSSDM